ncbi:hypothetical protein Ahu01nite_004230 [Winogradskya humida]|uniref:Uncharacterized protein n=1 Tax=Winogradskya humida TaxID=113566 RepID=A0ABQ3ZFG7_9ACTN|nr:hypothetical protein Ahu01nite_004230 [Actinoplanes humidus]
MAQRDGEAEEFNDDRHDVDEPAATLVAGQKYQQRHECHHDDPDNQQPERPAAGAGPAPVSVCHTAWCAPAALSGGGHLTIQDDRWAGAARTMSISDGHRTTQDTGT